VRGWLDAAGIRFEECRILDDRTAPARAAALVSTASCLFLMGGQTTKQLRFLRDYGLVEPIRQSGAAVLGLSAGAINMARLSFTLREPPYLGLALADITVTPHFEKRRDDPALIEEIKAVSSEHPIYAMCDGSAIFARGEIIEMLGEIYKIDQGTIEGVSP
jgi:peptidase E